MPTPSGPSASRTWVAALGLALLPLLFVVPVSAAAVILELDVLATMLLTTVAVAASFATALGLLRRAGRSTGRGVGDPARPTLSDVGWRRPSGIRSALWFLPVVAAVLLVAVILVVDGVEATPDVVAAGVLLAVVVGLAEESWYRGLVLRTLLRRGESTAVWGSAVLFAVVHSATMLGGAELVPTLLQMLFALLFGLVTALLVLRTGSLLPGIVWHVAHNAMSFASADAFTVTFGVAYSLIGLILVAYAVWLWTRR